MHNRFIHFRDQNYYYDFLGDLKTQKRKFRFKLKFIEIAWWDDAWKWFEKPVSQDWPDMQLY